LLQGAVVDFDMTAVLQELVRIGLLIEDQSKGTICAVPIDRAIEIMSIRNYPEGAAEMPFLSGGRRASRLNWTAPPDSLKREMNKVWFLWKLELAPPSDECTWYHSFGVTFSKICTLACCWRSVWLQHGKNFMPSPQAHTYVWGATELDVVNVVGTKQVFRPWWIKCKWFLQKQEAMASTGSMEVSMNIMAVPASEGIATAAQVPDNMRRSANGW
jgi:hypothetical protein